MTTSLMPDNIALGLDARDLADLVAYLRAGDTARLQTGPEIQLFDGHSLAGWTGFCADGTKTEAVWSVRDGILVDRGSPVGYLRTEKEFTDYLLTVEWRFPPGGKPGNGGVLLRQVGPDKVWPKSIESQLQDQEAGDIWNIDEVAMHVDRDRTQGRRTIKLQPSSELPQGQWNRYEILLHGGFLRLTVNGVIQNEASECAVVPGHICLQAEGSAMEFRRITLREIR
jgi:3-keto-disaccharide hydrolase